MKKTAKLLKAGFESSSGKTPEFEAFVKTFKSEFTKELKAAGAEDITFRVGHFEVSGNFNMNFGSDGTQMWYFTTTDVRNFSYRPAYQRELMYRKVTGPTDYSGGSNTYVLIEKDMHLKMTRLK